MKRDAICLLVMICLLTGPLWSQEAEQPTDAEAAIGQTVDSYVAAFNQGDAKALAEQWSESAVYTNRLTGEEAVGRAAIAEQFAGIFKEKPGLKLDVSIESIRLLSPNVAVEHGTAKTIPPEGEPDKMNYTAVYVQQGGKWLLDRVTDGADQPPPSNYEQLKALEWMVGSWVDEDEEARVETECKWTKNRNFLTRSYSIIVGDQAELSGIQVIGWDIRFRWRLCRGHLDPQKRPLVHSQQGGAGRRAKSVGSQYPQARRCGLVHLANDRAKCGGRDAPQR
jgi:uncharacterized protein (TIGR02246 family)